VGRNGFFESCQFLPMETDSLSAGETLRGKYSNVKGERDKIVPFFLIPLAGGTDEVEIADDIASRIMEETMEGQICNKNEDK
jgi:hypothetical protein